MKQRHLFLGAAGLALFLLGGTSVVAAPAPSADPAKGKTVFARCAMCHDLKPGVNRLGPSLAGLFGRKAGTVPNFNYSPAMKGARIVWNERSLYAYLANPQGAVPRNKMIFAGIANPADRANLIAYLKAATK